MIARRLLAAAALVTAFAAALAPRPARADDQPAAPPDPRPELTWRWPRFRTAEYIATPIIAAGIFPTLAIQTSATPWRAPNGFDEGARDALRLGTDSARWIARDTSDVLLTLAVSYPLLVDSIAVAWWGRKSPDVAWQMAAIDLEAFAFNGVLSALISAATSRERPYGRLCSDDPNDPNRDCTGSKRYRSFFSGHTSTSFTSAGLVCMHHAYLPLFRGAGDPLACATAMAAAATVGALRIVSDQHYLSDVLVGAAVGAASGLGVPWLLHYRSGPALKSSGRDGTSISIIPSPTGGAIVGAF